MSVVPRVITRSNEINARIITRVKTETKQKKLTGRAILF